MDMSWDTSQPDERASQVLLGHHHDGSGVQIDEHACPELIFEADYYLAPVAKRDPRVPEVRRPQRWE